MFDPVPAQWEAVVAVSEEAPTSLFLHPPVTWSATAGTSGFYQGRTQLAAWMRVNPLAGVAVSDTEAAVTVIDPTDDAGKDGGEADPL